MSSDMLAAKGFPTDRMAAYLSLSAAGMMATNSMAEVVHVPAQNLPVEIVNDGQLFLFFSLRSPGVADSYDIEFRAQESYGGTFLPRIGNQGSVRHLVSFENRPNGAFTSVGPGTTIDSSLDAPDDVFWSNSYLLDPDEFDGPRHYLPVRFGDSGDYHFGFIEIEITPERSLRILDAAWENELNVPITTPSALNDAVLGALAGGDDSVASVRRID